MYRLSQRCSLKFPWEESVLLSRDISGFDDLTSLSIIFKQVSGGDVRLPWNARVPQRVMDLQDCV